MLNKKHVLPEHAFFVLFKAMAISIVIKNIIKKEGLLIIMSNNY
jgi:hypothetical protein